MDISFWEARWQRGETGFHLPRPHPKLISLWPELVRDSQAAVFVPLCGKSLDLRWLQERGHTVYAVEASELAVQSYFAEQQLTPLVSEHGSFRCYRHQQLNIYCGDFFALTAAELGCCSAIYDRAALIALPPLLRARYAAHLQQLMPRATTLLLTLRYPQAEMAGPPFSVDEDELAVLYPAADRCLLLDHDILMYEPRFVAKGVTRLHEQAWSMRW